MAGPFWDPMFKHTQIGFPSQEPGQSGTTYCSAQETFPSPSRSLQKILKRTVPYFSKEQLFAYRDFIWLTGRFIETLNL